VLHFAEDCLLNFLVGVSRAGDFFFAEQVENAVAASFHLGRLTQVLELVFNRVLNCLTVVGYAETGT
jgi:hypothetical protein